MRKTQKVSHQLLAFSHLQSAFSHQLTDISHQFGVKLLVLSFYFLLLTFNCFAQVGINSTGSAPASSAILDVSSSAKGTLITRMTTAQMTAIASPAIGLIVYNTDCNTVNYFNGAKWIALGNTGSISAPGSITGITSPCQNATGIAYSISSVTGATGYNWTVPTGATIASGQGTTAITVNFGTVSGNVCVTADNTCGTSIAGCSAITLNVGIPASVSATATPNPVCTGNSMTLTGGSTGASSWSWSGPNTYTSTSQSPTLSITGTAQGGVYTLTATNCNGSATNTVSVTVSTTPSAVTVSGGGAICSSTILTASGGAGGTIYWQNTTSGGTSLSTPSSSQTVSSAGTYYFRANSGSCWGTEGSATVTISSPPAQPTATVSTQPTCAAQSGAITITAPTGSGMTYSIDNGITYTNTTGIFSGVISGTYTVTAKNSSGCVSPSRIMTTNLIQPCPCTWNSATSFTDARDSKVYNQVKIGNQCWMATNLSYGNYIPYDGTTPLALGQKYCSGYGGAFDNNSSCPIGGLYQWYVAMNQGPPAGAYGCDGTGAGQPACTTPVVGICPSGWHLPSNYEWILLAQNVGTPLEGSFVFPFVQTEPNNVGNNNEGGNIMSTSTHWQTNTIATNYSGFAAEPAGYASGAFNFVGQLAMWWSSYAGPSGGGNFQAMQHSVFYTQSGLSQQLYFQSANCIALSVRCVR